MDNIKRFVLWLLFGLANREFGREEEGWEINTGYQSFDFQSSEFALIVSFNEVNPPFKGASSTPALPGSLSLSLHPFIPKDNLALVQGYCIKPSGCPRPSCSIV